MEYKPMYYPMLQQVDELQLCDDDIREFFEDKDYVMGMPLQAQILKELRKLNSAFGLPRPTQSRSNGALERPVSVPPPPSDVDRHPL